MDPIVSSKQYQKPKNERFEPTVPINADEVYPHEFLLIVNQKQLKYILEGAEPNNAKLLWDI